MNANPSASMTRPLLLGAPVLGGFVLGGLVLGGLALTGLFSPAAALSDGGPTASAREDEGPEVVRSWQDYWKAKGEKGRHKAGRRLLEAGVDFSTARAHLQRGRSYDPSAPTGLRRRSHSIDRGLVHRFAVVVPPSYSPETPHTLIVYLHGGVQRPSPSAQERWWPPGLETAEEGEILVLPAAWSESVWWQGTQARNLDAILHEVRRLYNIDENRVHLMGVSDGGTGAYFQAFRQPTAWASYLPLIGHSRVLGNPRVEPDGQMYPINLSGQPFFVVNGANDRLYPSWSVAPYLDLFAAAGAEIVFRHQPDGGHDLRWWPDEADRMNAFIQAHPRDPLPDRLVWETERTDRYQRNHWLLIDTLGAAPGEPDLPVLNAVRQPDGPSGTVEAFPHPLPSGRVEVHRNGNMIAARSQGVRAFRLLLSATTIEFSEPIQIYSNGSVVHDGLLTPDVATLLHWAPIDDDRTALYAVEVSVDVAAGSISVVPH